MSKKTPIQVGDRVELLPGGMWGTCASPPLQDGRIYTVEKLTDCVNCTVLKLQGEGSWVLDCEVRRVRKAKKMKLIDKIRAVDAEAADWLQASSKEIPHYDPTAEHLIEAFIWAETPQGHDYWDRIAHRLGWV